MGAETIVIVEPQCSDCAFFMWWMDEPKPICRAFPFGIPDGIWDGSIDHTQPVDGDNGIQYRQREP